MEYAELILRWLLGLQFLFWGLNGFFHWKPIPPSTKAINDFSEACHKTRFILPTVKIFEIVFGSLLLMGTAVPMALTALTPIVFVITGLHVIHNKRFWEVVLPISLPFLTLLLLHWDAWKGFIFN